MGALCKQEPNETFNDMQYIVILAQSIFKHSIFDSSLTIVTFIFIVIFSVYFLNLDLGMSIFGKVVSMVSVDEG